MNGFKPAIRLTGYEGDVLPPWGEWLFEAMGTVPNIGDVILGPARRRSHGPVVVKKASMAPSPVNRAFGTC